MNHPHRVNREKRTTLRLSLLFSVSKHLNSKTQGRRKAAMSIEVAFFECLEWVAVSTDRRNTLVK
jgi:hypothetical protein